MQILEITKIEYDIILCKYLCSQLNLADAKSALNERVTEQSNLLPNTKDVKLLIDTSKLKKVSKDARTFLSSEEGQEGIESCAILVKSSLTATIANFFVKIDFSNKNSKVPVKLFSNKNSAIKWLK